MAQAPIDLLASKSAVPLTLVFDEDDPGLGVETATAVAGLSRNFAVTLRVKHPRSDINPATLVGRKARVTLTEQPGLAFAGMISTARFVSANEHTAHYELLLQPRTEWMGLRRDHRVFKDMKATDLAIEIATPLVDRVGSILVFDDSTLPVHEYRVQYGETDLVAMSRLLADDGVSYLFDMSHDCNLVLVPDTTTYTGPEILLPYTGNAGLRVGGEGAIVSVALLAHECIRQVEQRDAWMEKPDFEAVSLVGYEEADDPLALYSFDARVENTEGDLERQAWLKLYEHATPAKLIEVTANRFVQPGSTLRIDHAPIREAEGKLLVLASRSRWSAGENAAATHVFTCIRQDRRWTPPRLPRQVVPGLQKAFVVGDGEIDTDEYGRVLCCFDWDRGRKVTRRVEVSQGWAGAGYGIFSQPRVGEQVLVAYLDGDPDEPIVVGRVHNGKNRQPVKLPAEKAVSAWRTRSTPDSDGYNEIRMDDTAGAELISIHAELDLNTVIERDGRATCGRDFTFEVARNTNLKVKGLTNVQCSSPARWEGVDLSLNASNSLAIQVGSYRYDRCGGPWDQSAKSITVETEGDETHANGGLFKVEAPHIFLSAFGTFISIKSGNITLSCGGSSLVMTPGKMTLVSPLIELNP